MAVQDSIKRLFQLYVGKNISEKGRMIFGSWLHAQENQQEKEEEMQRVWQEAEGEVSDSTLEDWNHLLGQMNKQSSAKKYYLSFIKYAAVIGLLLAVVGITYWTTAYVSRKPMEMVELFVPYGETREVVLPDNSKMWVNAGSMVIYPENFECMDTRSIYLSGEAYFSVAKNKEKPFIVKTAKLNVEALGTVFDVRAYSDDTFTSATLENGSVKVSLKDGQNESYILTPSDQLIYSHPDKSVKCLRVDIESFKRLRKGYLIFDNSDFDNIMSTIEKKYGVKIQYNSTNYDNDLYNLKFSPDESLETVMDILKELIGFEYNIKNNNIIIK